MKKFSFKKKIFIIFLLLITIHLINKNLSPVVVIHAPKKIMLIFYYQYQYVEDKDFTEDMLSDSSFKGFGIASDVSSSLPLNWKSPRNSNFSIRWFLGKEVLVPSHFDDEVYRSYEELMVNGDSVSEDWEIKYQDIDFCRLDIYVGDDGKIARQEKSGWFCIK